MSGRGTQRSPRRRGRARDVFDLVERIFDVRLEIGAGLHGCRRRALLPHCRGVPEIGARAGYDKYDRKGPKIIVGEWGAYETPFEPWNPRSRNEAPTPNLRAAIGDAAWMTEMERKSDLVIMHGCAPLLVNVSPGARQWRPNLIGYDALAVYGSPS
jgi:Alpha-L-arabinofuranosidase C-terminal domain